MKKDTLLIIILRNTLAIMAIPTKKLNLKPSSFIYCVNNFKLYNLKVVPAS